jgi:hypothetical protein
MYFCLSAKCARRKTLVIDQSSATATAIAVKRVSGGRLAAGFSAKTPPRDTGSRNFVDGQSNRGI